MNGVTPTVALIPLGIALDEHADRTVAAFTFACFFVFCFMGYLTGCYVPVTPICQCWVLSWNPFLREPLFMSKLETVSRKEYVVIIKLNTE